ncbi:MAG: DUF5684 domain-containing protein [Eubacteriales bacterium]|nr:DUF5684 domain-containing protein [Eubacteriales bacterium]
MSMAAWLLGLGAALVVLALIYWILCIIGYWKVFNKAGEPGWKSIIPIYNTYTAYKIAWKGWMYWVMLALTAVGAWMSAGTGVLAALGGLLAFAAMVIGVIFCYKTAKAFGYGVLFTIGLIFFNPIFTIVLGFDSSRYQGPQ